MALDLKFVVPSKGVKTLRDFITRIPKELEHHVAFVNSTQTQYKKITYAEVKTFVNGLANSLTGLGVKRGDRVALLSENRTEWALTYFAIVSLGAIVVPLDTLLMANELAPLLADSGAEVVFVSSGQKTKIEFIKEVIPALRAVVVFDRVQETLETVERKEAQDMIARLVSMQTVPTFMKEFFQKHGDDIAFSLDKQIVEAQSGYYDFAALLEAGIGLCSKEGLCFDENRLQPEDIAAIIYTSGTTGKPKGVVLTHGNLASNADNVQMLDRFAHSDRWVTLLPLHHTLPTMGGLLVPFLTGGTVRFVASLRTDLILEAFHEMKVTSIVTVPLFLEKIYLNIWKTVKEKGNLVYGLFRSMFYFARFVKKLIGINPGRILFRGVREKLGLNHLKYFICGGGPIAREILKGFDVLGIFVAQGYGLSETSPVLSCNNLKVNRFGSVGFPLKEAEVIIHEPDKNGNGEILARAPFLMKGYYQQQEMTDEVIDKEGWFHTGDIGRFDKDGFLWITGRLKNIIVTAGGKNIYPEELEEILLKSECIAEAVIVGSRDFESGSETPYAIVYPNFDAIGKVEQERGVKFDEDGLYEFIGQEIKRVSQDVASYKKITGFELMYEELPKTSSKKIKRFLFHKKG